MNVSFEPLIELPGFLGASLADSDTGLIVAMTEGAKLDLEIAAAANTEVVRAKRKALDMLGFKDRIEDLTITIDSQYHLLRILKKHRSLYLYVAIDRAKANLGLARIAMTKLADTLDERL